MVLRLDRERDEARWAGLITVLSKARGEADLTQEAVAEEVGVLGPAIDAWEACEDFPVLSHFIVWASVLGMRLAVGDPADIPTLPTVQLDEDETLAQHEVRRLTATLCSLRRARGMTLTSLAERVGVSRFAISRWEGAVLFPRPIALVVWARVLGCSIMLIPVT
jgi:transcriptional regulator with XRE-family HTH domain